MRAIWISILLVGFSANEALAWRCGDPDRPKCPNGLCVHDLTLQSDYCAQGIIFADTPMGPSITVTSPKLQKMLQRLQTK
jgi:hypothetical protein